MARNSDWSGPSRASVNLSAGAGSAASRKGARISRSKLARPLNWLRRNGAEATRARGLKLKLRLKLRLKRLERSAKLNSFPMQIAATSSSQHFFGPLPTWERRKCFNCSRRRATRPPQASADRPTDRSPDCQPAASCLMPPLPPPLPPPPRPPYSSSASSASSLSPAPPPLVLRVSPSPTQDARRKPRAVELPLPVRRCLNKGSGRARATLSVHLSSTGCVFV